jgi:hypothetical protein
LRPMMAASTVAKKGAHRVILRHEEEVDCSVRACDITVEADAQAENDFAHDAALYTPTNSLLTPFSCVSDAWGISRHDDRRSVDGVILDGYERFVGLFQRKYSHLGLQPDVGGDL